jgi:transcription antitermination factor NusA-like protein
MPFIEVFDPVERSFYRGELHSVTGKLANIIFEGCTQPTEVETRFIRPEASPAPEGFTPELQSVVEVRFHLPDQAPSYWEGTISTIVPGGKALVKFPNPSCNDIFDFSAMRPASGLSIGNCVFEYVPIPHDCHEKFMEHNKVGVDYVYKQSHLTSLCYVPSKRALALYGAPSAVVEAKSLLSIVFAKSKQLNEGMKRLASTKSRVIHDHATVTFTIPSHLVGIVVGKEFKNIKELKAALQLKDVTFEKLAEDDSQTLVSVFADSREKGELAKKQLHFVERTVEIKDRNHVRSIIGQGGSEILNMKQQTGVPVILVKDKEDPPHVVICGLKESVDQCVKMIEIICIYEPEFRTLEGELQGAGVVRGGSQRFQNFRERQQRSTLRADSTVEFPALPVAHSVIQPKQHSVVAGSDPASAVARPDLSAHAASGGRGGKARSSKGGVVSVALAPAVDVADVHETAPLPRSRADRGGKLLRGGGVSANADHRTDDSRPTNPSPLPSDSFRGKTNGSRGGRGRGV